MSSPAPLLSPGRLAALAAVLAIAAAGCVDRELPTGYGPSAFVAVGGPVVNSLDDVNDGTCNEAHCSLREAIDAAVAGDVITFSVTGTIVVSNVLVIEKSLTIQGPGADALAVSGNDLVQVFNVYGGSVYAEIRSLTIRNGKYDNGGALFVGYAQLVLDSVVVLNSTATGANYSYGGGISANRATVTIRNSTITGNTASGAYLGLGGGISNGFGTLVLENSTVSGNSATLGGGIHNDNGGTVTLLNSTVSGNSGTITGGGIQGEVGSVTIAYSTVSANTAANTGGGILSQGGLTLTSALVAANSAPGSPDLHDGYQAATATYSLIGSTIGHAIPNGTNGNIVGSAALLGALASNGGVTQTHALGAGSPAIDAIPSGTNGCGTSPATDQRGIARPQGSACDIGAFELQETGGPVAPDFSFDLSTLPAKTYGDAPFSVAGYVTTNSTGTIAFAAGPGSVGCDVNAAGTVTITGAAVSPSACWVEAVLAAGGSYTGAGPIAQGFNIAKAAGSVTISNLPASATVGGSFTPTYTVAGDGVASTASTTPAVCTVSAGVVSYVGAGTCSLQASVTGGTNHLAATGSAQTFEVAPVVAAFTSSCTYVINVRNGQRMVTVAWANAEPGVTLIQLVDGRAVTKQFAPTATGTWSTNVKADPSYGMWGGSGRKDTSIELVPAGTPCTQ